MTITSGIPLSGPGLMPRRPPLMSHLKSAATGVNGMNHGGNHLLGKSAGINVVLGKPQTETDSRFGFLAGRVSRG